jgi:MOSC domain-containing protein YiiM
MVKPISSEIGGVEKAVLAYAAEHYPSWRSPLNLPDLSYGAFGENFTVANQTEPSICIGDIYDIGEAQVQASQPRQPCWKLSRRWRIRNLALQVQTTGQTGWYFRVLKEGIVAPGMELVLRDRPAMDDCTSEPDHAPRLERSRSGGGTRKLSVAGIELATDFAQSCG